MNVTGPSPDWCGFVWEPGTARQFAFTRVCNLPPGHDGPHYGGRDLTLDWFPAPPSNAIGAKSREPQRRSRFRRLWRLLALWIGEDW